ncbi:hypothetical protein M1D48_12250 [Erwinia sp. D4-22]
MKITGIDKEFSSKDLGFGDRYLVLDSPPGRTWINLFQEAYANYFSPNKKNAFIKNGYLVVQCPADELQEQINILNKIVRSADEKINAIKLRAEQEAQERARLDAEMRKKADDVYDNLKFE